MHNLVSKENSVIHKEGCANHTTIFIDRFLSEDKSDIIFTIERHE